MIHNVKAPDLTPAQAANVSQMRRVIDRFTTDPRT
eukprot:gene5156-3987_t